MPSSSCAVGIGIPPGAVVVVPKAFGSIGCVKSAKLKSGMFKSPVFCSMGKYLSHSACTVSVVVLR